MCMGGRGEVSMCVYGIGNGVWVVVGWDMENNGGITCLPTVGRYS